MSQSLLFQIGSVVFAITVCATLLYGYFALDRVYQSARPVGTPTDTVGETSSAVTDKVVVAASPPESVTS